MLCDDVINNKNKTSIQHHNYMLCVVRTQCKEMSISMYWTLVNQLSIFSFFDTFKSFRGYVSILTQPITLSSAQRKQSPFLVLCKLPVWNLEKKVFPNGFVFVAHLCVNPLLWLVCACFSSISCFLSQSANERTMVSCGAEGCVRDGASVPQLVGNTEVWGVSGVTVSSKIRLSYRWRIN